MLPIAPSQNAVALSADALFELAESIWSSLLRACPKTLVRQAAAAMFKATPSAMTETELWNVIGELTHMLGGNLKSLLPAPCHLSLPSVIEGYNIPMKGPVVERILLRCEGQPLQIILFEREK